MTPPAKPLELGVHYGPHLAVEMTECGNYKCRCRNCGAESVKSRKGLLDARRFKMQWCVKCCPRNTTRKFETAPRNASGKFVSRMDGAE